MQKLLNDFINVYVLCPYCNLPETNLIYHKKNIYHKCDACGHETAVNPAARLCMSATVVVDFVHSDFHHQFDVQVWRN